MPEAAALREIVDLGGPFDTNEPEPPHTWQHSPNRSRRTGAVDMIVLHCTAGANTAGAVATLCDPKREASAHIVIPDPSKPGEPQKTVRLVPDEFAAWHARSSLSIGGRTGVNSRSLGIELVNTAMAEDPYHPWQVEECARWCRYWMDKFPIRWIVTHAYLDPSRRRDPCITFPWKLFLDKVLEKFQLPTEAVHLVVSVNGKVVDADVEIRDGSTWGELRPIVEALGGTIKKNGNHIEITK